MAEWLVFLIAAGGFLAWGFACYRLGVNRNRATALAEIVKLETTASREVINGIDWLRARLGYPPKMAA